MRFFSNLPDDEHVPFKFIAADPHVKDVVRYFRPSDYLHSTAVALGGPAIFYAWERYSPSFHPRVLPKILLVQFPFFAACGVLFAAQSTYFRFWGWTENDREVKKWEAESEMRRERDAGKEKWGWQDNDW
ncbi:hypothetical protein HK099_006092 [Clydaea vesicula]|uniref:NADH-ubiquinone oxidoreductase 21kDa subunit N-terminal domain-containing protein n=1 Tax=Clydaea vesicula TaxID=447962 RepID=A0AAD5XX67_9FUNG|nr:hypothetical protein HK099_006092 [Clydaea vesicula]KAJ3380256.1 hypothetical protein HDU92_006088 [Lobulomyces angularis]